MKKLFLFIAALLATTTLWAQRFQVGDLYYSVTSNSAPYTVKVTHQLDGSCDNYGYLKDVVIPEKVTYNNITYLVTAIGERAFAVPCFPSSSQISSVTIPHSVTSIGDGAFRGCISLESITIPNSVISIGDGAFNGCSSLTSITIPNSVTSIGYAAFQDCSSLTSIAVESGNTVYDSRENSNAIIETGTNTLICGCQNTIIPNSVTSIEDWAFYGCTLLESITIPEGVTSIGNYAFSGCSSPTSVTIPNSVMSISSHAFYLCAFTKDNFINNTTLDAEENNYWGARIGDKEIDGLLIKDDTILVACRPHLTFVTIPNSVTSIGDDAFYGCSSLASVTIPNSVKSIGDDAFYGCTLLESITIPNSVTSIGVGAFSGTKWYSNQPNGVVYIGKVLYHYRGNMPKNTSIDIKNGTVSISPYAFSYCSSLTSVTIPNSVTSIGSGTFNECSSLTSITIPNSVMSIGGSAFSGCSSLTSITIPNSVTSIGYRAFYGCSSLTSISIPEGVTSVGDDAFGYCSSLTSVTLNSNDIVSTSRMSNIFGSQVEEYVIGNSVTSIGDYAFSYCSSLTSITIPNSVTSIGHGAFYRCTSLTSVTIPESVTSIEDNAFSGCTLLESITIPNSVTSIGDDAFSGCTSLESITIPNSVTSIGGGAFSNCSSFTSIAIPCNVTRVDETSFDGCSSLTSVNWNAISCQLYGTTISPFHSSKSTLKSIIFGDSVEYIPEYICAYLDSLKYVTIGNSVTSIGKNAFSCCDSITKTNYTGDVASWCNIKFGNFSANPMYYSHNFYINDQEIKDLVIPNSVDSIHDRAFDGCSSLTSITIPNSVTSIGSGTFNECSSLTSITIPNSVMSIGGSAFSGCSSLTSITIPNSVTSIGRHAFSSCSSLRSAIIGSGVPEIADYAFSDCSSLSYVAIGSRVENVGYSAFRDCPIDTVYSRNPTPPQLESGYRQEPFTSKPVCCIPCGATSSYKNSSWKSYMSEFIDGNVYFLNTSVSDSLAGRVETIKEPRCDEGATIQAIPTLGYEFVQWSDGVTDALRTLDLTQDTTLIAEFRQLFDGKCGDNLYWKHYDDKIIIHGEGTMYDYAADSVPWYQFRDIVKTVEVFDGATSIGNNAFTLCKNLNTLTLSGTIENIGENAFGGCRMLFDIYCYVLFPPIASETSFVNYNAYLYILCDYQRYYAVDMVFGNFRNMQCIGTQSTPTDSMVITPSYNDVTITWPTESNAGSYTLAINKDGEVFCTLTFNAAGQLTGIAFAPSRNGQRHAPAATQAANGFTFTVTGLEEGTDYSYNLVIKDNSGKTLQTYSGEFRTQSTSDRTVTVEYDAAQGQVTGAGTYLVGDTVTLTAIPNDGYRFVRWSNEVEDNPYTFVISDNVTLSAEFEEVITTSVENTTPSQQSDTHKLLRDGQLLIIRDGKTYNAMGQEI